MLLSILQRRAALYEQSAQKVLNYFIQSGRLVMVDVTCGIAELIWHQVHHVFCELDFRPLRTVNTILLFVFGNVWPLAAPDFYIYIRCYVCLSVCLSVCLFVCP